MAKRQTAVVATAAARPQTGEISLLIAASQFVREAGGWREAEEQLRAVHDFVNACGGSEESNGDPTTAATSTGWPRQSLAPPKRSSSKNRSAKSSRFRSLKNDKSPPDWRALV